MASNTYTLISSVTVGAGGASSIDFTSIPSTYTDLLVKLSSRSNQNDFNVTDVYVSFNGSSANQTQRNLRGWSSGATSQTRTDILFGNMPSATNTTSTFSNSEMYIPNYAGSNYKSVSIDGVSESNSSGTYDWWLNLVASLWSSTSTINQITLTPSGGWSFAQYSTAYLYGIKSS